MPQTLQTTYLLASREPALLAAVEPVLAARGRVEVVLSPEAALAAMTADAPPGMALLDARMPDLDLWRVLAAARAKAHEHFPVVLFADKISDEFQTRLQEGVLDDLLPTTLTAQQLAIRVDIALRDHRRALELEELRDVIARSQHTDRLTGAYTRDTMLSLLFRETDRVQRMNGSLCLILFDIDDFGHWNARLGTAACDLILTQVAGRVARLLRSYDLLGRVGKDEFLAGLPGCTALNGVLLAERIRAEVFAPPFQVADVPVRLTACYGIAPSHGRSPVVVLREAEEALHIARSAGPESIHCPAGGPTARQAPVAFLSADDRLSW